MKVKVRIAPSPTGVLHIGNAQSALYNWLFARKNGGEFYLRIEDTDKERSTKEFDQSIQNALEWLGLRWDGKVIHQSENIKRHQAAIEKLLTDGKAFYCHHTKEELETERKEQEIRKEPPKHICEHKNSEKGKQSGGIIRLNVPDRIISFNDQIRGPIEFNAELLGNFSIARAVDGPLYNLAVVVDDSDMGITHIIRGEDHISNTPKQILIYEALGLPPPQFAHLPLILAPDRSKLSKRHSGTSTLDYKKDYLPEALINFLGGLSYTFNEDIISWEEMIKEFELEKVHKSGAAFDIKKLNWINSQYIKKLSPKDFKALTNINLPEKSIPLVTERLEKLSDVQNFCYFWEEPEYNKELLKWKDFTFEDIKKSLKKSRIIVEKTEDEDTIRLALDELGKKLGVRGLAYWPLRVALTGKEKSPDPVDILNVLEKEEALKRVDNAIKKLE